MYPVALSSRTRAFFSPVNPCEAVLREMMWSAVT